MAERIKAILVFKQNANKDDRVPASLLNAANAETHGG